MVLRRAALGAPEAEESWLLGVLMKRFRSKQPATPPAFDATVRRRILGGTAPADPPSPPVEPSRPRTGWKLRGFRLVGGGLILGAALLAVGMLTGGARGTLPDLWPGPPGPAPDPTNDGAALDSRAAPAGEDRAAPPPGTPAVAVEAANPSIATAWAGWTTRSGWSVAGTLLQNDGSDFGDANWDKGLWNQRWVPAPELLPSPAQAFFVEAEILVQQRPACGSFGLVVAGHYQVGLHDCERGGAPAIAIRSRLPQELSSRALEPGFDPADGWHLYRVEVRTEGQRAILHAFVDGFPVLEATDAVPSSDRSATRSAGLWDDHTQLVVRAFRSGPLPGSEPIGAGSP